MSPFSFSGDNGGSSMRGEMKGSRSIPLEEEGRDPGSWPSRKSHPVGQVSVRCPLDRGTPMNRNVPETIRAVGPEGFEPSFPDPKSGVLPLDEGPAIRAPEETLTAI